MPLISGDPWRGNIIGTLLEFPDPECVAACERNGYAAGQQTTYVQELDIFNCGDDSGPPPLSVDYDYAPPLLS